MEVSLDVVFSNEEPTDEAFAMTLPVVPLLRVMTQEVAAPLPSDWQAMLMESIGGLNIATSTKACCVVTI